MLCIGSPEEWYWVFQTHWPVRTLDKHEFIGKISTFDNISNNIFYQSSRYCCANLKSIARFSFWQWQTRLASWPNSAQKHFDCRMRVFSSSEVVYYTTLWFLTSLHMAHTFWEYSHCISLREKQGVSHAPFLHFFNLFMLFLPVLEKLLWNYSLFKVV